jgi:uncharacterized protein YfaS (alpha-2-macroglobulin family)
VVRGDTLTTGERDFIRGMGGSVAAYRDALVGAAIEIKERKLVTTEKFVVDDAMRVTWSLARASEYKSLMLDVPASADGMYLVISSEGVRAGANYKTGGNGLAISRSYRNLAGDTLDLSDGKVQLGDLVFVELELSNISGITTQNIALVDRLPAGFEVENSRLGRSFKADWIDPEADWAVDYFNLRDDRLEAFGSLAGNTSKKIIYTVRAVTSGKYATPPVEAEAMYDPTLWARERSTGLASSCSGAM